jgi:hypothetical protein
MDDSSGGIVESPGMRPINLMGGALYIAVKYLIEIGIASAGV